MKANWKLALMAIATLAFVACNKKDEPKNNDDKGDDEEEEQEFVSPISTTDNSLADWDKLDANYVVSAKCDAKCSNWQALKTLKVYADKMYLNIYAEFDDAAIADRSWTPFHVYLNADNDATTGGYTDEFTDGASEVLLEGAIFSEGAAYQYNPAVFHWFGATNGGVKDQSDNAKGWYWTDASVSHDDSDGWGAIVATGALPIGTSEVIGNVVEIQLLRELIPMPTGCAWNETAFGVGVDIQQNWNSCGVLPNAADDADGNAVTANKLTVKIQK